MDADTARSLGLHQTAAAIEWKQVIAQLDRQERRRASWWQLHRHKVAALACLIFAGISATHAVTTRVAWFIPVHVAAALSSISYAREYDKLNYRKPFQPWEGVCIGLAIVGVATIIARLIVNGLDVDPTIYVELGR